jgi:ankyrin repeat protein
MEWYRAFVFNNMYLTNVNATATATANATATATATVTANATVYAAFNTTLLYGHNNNIVHSFFIVSNNYSLTIFSCIITILLTLAGSFYIVLIIDFILRLMFNNYNYDNYLYSNDYDLIRAVRYNDIGSVKKLLESPDTDVNIVDIGTRRTALEISVIERHISIVEALLRHPLIHNSVARLEEDDINDSPLSTDINWLIQYWYKKQEICYAALKGGRNLDIPFESAISLLSAEELSTTRDFNGYTPLGNAVAAGNMKYIHALIKTGASLLVAANLSGTSVGAVAMRAGSRAIADMLYYRTLKAFCRRRPMFNRLRSEIIIGNRVNMPRELVNCIMEYVVDIELPPGFIRD